jgi:hypothetical protein
MIFFTGEEGHWFTETSLFWAKAWEPGSSSGQVIYINMRGRQVDISQKHIHRIFTPHEDILGLLWLALARGESVCECACGANTFYLFVADRMQPVFSATPRGLPAPTVTPSLPLILGLFWSGICNIDVVHDRGRGRRQIHFWLIEVIFPYIVGTFFVNLPKYLFIHS